MKQGSSAHGSKIDNLRAFAESRGIQMPSPKAVVDEAAASMARKYPDISRIKSEFDKLILETEEEVYDVYLKHEGQYGSAVIKAFADHLVQSGEIASLGQTGSVLSNYFRVLDKFYVSLGNSRKARAGGAFEMIHNSLFKRLGYTFDEQKVINGKPDFLMPSERYFKRNAPDCIIFTAKRTIRERWRQVVTEGARGAGFFLATIDGSVSDNALKGMLDNRITLVVPESIRAKSYPNRNNVLSFKQFFEDHLDPAVERWRRRGVI
jgi:EcoRII C terminal